MSQANLDQKTPTAEQASEQEIKYKFDQLRSAVEANLWDNEWIKEVKNKLNQAFQADITELKDVLDNTWDQEVDAVIAQINSQMQIGLNTLKKDSIETTNNIRKLDANTQNKLQKFVTSLNDNYFNALIQQASIKDWAWEAPNEEAENTNAPFEQADKKGQEANTKVDAIIKDKLGPTGGMLDFFAKKFFGVSLKDHIRDPDSPAGELLRWAFGMKIDKNTLKDAQDSFRDMDIGTMEELIWNKKGEITFPKELSLDKIKKENKEGGTILSSLQKFSVCNWLEVIDFNDGGNKLTLKAANWKQVAFLRRFLPQTKMPEGVSNLVEKYGDWLLEEVNLKDKKRSNSEYDKYKESFPNTVSVNNKGQEVTIAWQNMSVDGIGSIMDKIKNR